MGARIWAVYAVNFTFDRHSLFLYKESIRFMRLEVNEWQLLFIGSRLHNLL